MNPTKKNDPSDRRCALEDQGDIECVALLDGSDDWCHGCEFYVCEAHSQNLCLRIGGHDVMEHLESFADDTIDD